MRKAPSAGTSARWPPSRASRSSSAAPRACAAPASPRVQRDAAGRGTRPRPPACRAGRGARSRGSSGSKPCRYASRTRRSASAGRLSRAACTAALTMRRVRSMPTPAGGSRNAASRRAHTTPAGGSGCPSPASASRSSRSERVAMSASGIATGPRAGAPVVAEAEDVEREAPPVVRGEGVERGHARAGHAEGQRVVDAVRREVAQAGGIAEAGRRRDRASRARSVSASPRAPWQVAHEAA